MPSKNRIKTYIKDGHYHIYNRGVAKQKIFRDFQDYNVFLKNLREALTIRKIKKVEFSLRGRSFKALPRDPKNFNKEIVLLCYCLMPNHFHILLKQNDKSSMESFMRSITTRYSTYFNKKYDRVGHLFQGRYKAAIILNDEYLLHLSRYIHLNPVEIETNLKKVHSSYLEYLSLRKTSWIDPSLILNYFNSNNSIANIIKVNTYQKFVEEYAKDSRKLLGELTLE